MTQLLAMTQELEELGGGDARIGRATVCCVVAALARPGQSILSPTADGLCVLDPRGVASTKHTTKVFAVPFQMQCHPCDSLVYDRLGQVHIYAAAIAA